MQGVVPCIRGRFIPTCVGNTEPRAARPPICTGSPHRCRRRPRLPRRLCPPGGIAKTVSFTIRTAIFLFYTMAVVGGYLCCWPAVPQPQAYHQFADQSGRSWACCTC